jgi:hypothetical protein
MERPNQGHLHPTRGPKTDVSRPGIKTGPPLWEASTLAKGYSKQQINSYSKRLNVIFVHVTRFKFVPVFPLHDLLPKGSHFLNKCAPLTILLFFLSCFHDKERTAVIM